MTDVKLFGKEIKDNNAQLTSNIETATDNLNAEIQTALDILIRGRWRNYIQ